MAFFLNRMMQSLSTLTSNLSIFKRMNQTISPFQLSEVRACLDDMFKEVESRHQTEMIDLDVLAIDNTRGDPDQDPDQNQNQDDNDWSTIASEDEEQENDPEAQAANETEQCNCHETTAQPIFALPHGIILGECPICYDEIKMINMTVSRCGHVFHASCIFACLERRIDCPLCRTQLVNEVFEIDEDE